MGQPELARVIVTAPILGICHMQVCAVADASEVEILEVCNRENPSGTTNGWAHVCRECEDEKQRPVPCQNDSTRLHILVSC